MSEHPFTAVLTRLCHLEQMCYAVDRPVPDSLALEEGEWWLDVEVEHGGRSAVVSWCAAEGGYGLFNPGSEDYYGERPHRRTPDCEEAAANIRAHLEFSRGAGSRVVSISGESEQ